MGYIRITEDNIGTEHICCAMSNNQSLQKKEWLKDRFHDGLVFSGVKSEENALLNICRLKMHGIL